MLCFPPQCDISISPSHITIHNKNYGVKILTPMILLSPMTTSLPLHRSLSFILSLQKCHTTIFLPFQNTTNNSFSHPFVISDQRNHIALRKLRRPRLFNLTKLHLFEMRVGDFNSSRKLNLEKPLSSFLI